MIDGIPIASLNATLLQQIKLLFLRALLLWFILLLLNGLLPGMPFFPEKIIVLRLLRSGCFGRCQGDLFPCISPFFPVLFSSHPLRLLMHWHLTSSFLSLIYTCLLNPIHIFFSDQLSSDQDKTLNHRFSLPEKLSLLPKLQSHTSVGSGLLHNQFLYACPGSIIMLFSGFLTSPFVLPISPQHGGPP